MSYPTPCELCNAPAGQPCEPDCRCIIIQAALDAGPVEPIGYIITSG